MTDPDFNERVKLSRVWWDGVDDGNEYVQEQAMAELIAVHTLALKGCTCDADIGLKFATRSRHHTTCPQHVLFMRRQDEQI